MTAAASQSPRPLDLAIIGGGISGITLAIALYKRGISCTVFEAAPGLTETRGAVPLSRNALRAMELIDRCVLGAFNLVSTRNQSASKKHVWADFIDGMSPQPATHLDPLFSIVGAGNVGHHVVRCARFLDELVRLLPRDMVRFDKELRHVLDDRIGSGKSKQYVGYEYHPPFYSVEKISYLVWENVQ
jgi:salicylate hydroxylase